MGSDSAVYFGAVTGKAKSCLDRRAERRLARLRGSAKAAKKARGHVGRRSRSHEPWRATILALLLGNRPVSPKCRNVERERQGPIKISRPRRARVASASRLANGSGGAVVEPRARHNQEPHGDGLADLQRPIRSRGVRCRRAVGACLRDGRWSSTVRKRHQPAPARAYPHQDTTRPKTADKTAAPTENACISMDDVARAPGGRQRTGVSIPIRRG
jgi:hypothetical protein